jgi:LuxR family maltose regulon positive regulatory protein
VPPRRETGDAWGPEPHLRAAHDALRRADWAAARAGFGAALDESDSPEAREGLAAATYWQGDTDAAIAAKEAAYRLYQGRGEAHAAARVATWLAYEYESGRGQPAVANGWLQRARRLLAGLPPSPELAWLEFWEAHILLLFRGDAPAARERLAAALRLSQEAALRDVELMARGLEGVMMAHEGNLAEGMRRLDEVTTAALAGEVGDFRAAGNACCYVLTTCEEIGDLERAAQWLSRVRHRYEPLRLVPIDTYCRTHAVGILLWLGKWAEAEEEIAKMESEARVFVPGFVPEATCRLGELRLRQGRLREADELFAKAETHPRAILGRAAIALERGNARGAVEGVERYLRQLAAGDRLGRLPALQLLVEAYTSSGDVALAAAAFAELDELSRRLDTAAPRAIARLAEGWVACAAGDRDQGRRCFEDAVAAFARLGAPYETARAREALARCLAALGRRDDAAHESRRAKEELLALGVADQAPDRSSTLTPREREVICLVAKGLSNKEIAARLGLSEHTVHRHVGNVLTRLDLPSRSAAVAHAAQLGLLDA